MNRNVSLHTQSEDYPVAALKTDKVTGQTYAHVNLCGESGADLYIMTPAYAKELRAQLDLVIAGWDMSADSFHRSLQASMERQP